MDDQHPSQEMNDEQKVDENSSQVEKKLFKKIPEEFYHLCSQTPIESLPPSFSIEKFQESIQKTFQLTDFTLSSNPFEWQEIDLYSQDDETVKISLEGFDSSCFMLIDEPTKRHLINTLMTTETDHLYTLDDALFHEIFKFCLLKLAELFHETHPDFHPKISFAPQEKTSGFFFVKTVLFSLNGVQWQVKLALSKQFKESLEKTNTKAQINLDQLESIPVSLQCHIAEIDLTMQEWQNIEEGDVIVLDHLLKKPKENKGEAIITFNNKKLFRAKLKNHQLKISNAL